VGIEAQKGADGLVKREEVERAARELMEGEGRMVIKKGMGELMGKARFAMAEGGSSYNALANVASNLFGRKCMPLKHHLLLENWKVSLAPE